MLNLDYNFVMDDFCNSRFCNSRFCNARFLSCTTLVMHDFVMHDFVIYNFVFHSLFPAKPRDEDEWKNYEKLGDDVIHIELAKRNQVCLLLCETCQSTTKCNEL